jgi:hypothetical protein
MSNATTTPASEAWTRFERQLRATGREKADGYSAAHFAGMTDEEKQRAFDLLEQEARVDPSSAEWLFHLDPRRAEAAGLAQLAQPGTSPYRSFILAHAIGHNSRDPHLQQRMQQQMIASYPQLPADTRLRALLRLGSTPPTNALRAFLEGVLLGESDPDLLGGAAHQLLRAHGVPYATEADKTRFRELLSRLSDPSPAARRQALRTL